MSTAAATAAVELPFSLDELGSCVSTWRHCSTDNEHMNHEDTLLAISCIAKHISALSSLMQNGGNTANEWMARIQADECALLRAIFFCIDSLLSPHGPSVSVSQTASVSAAVSSPTELVKLVDSLVDSLVFVLFMFSSLAPKIVSETLACNEPLVERLVMQLLPEACTIPRGLLTESAWNLNVLDDEKQANDADADADANAEQDEMSDENEALQQAIVGRLNLIERLMISAEQGRVMFGKSRYDILARFMGLLGSRSEAIFTSATRCVVLLYYHAKGNLLTRKMMAHPHVRVLSESLLMALNNAQHDQSLELHLLSMVQFIFARKVTHFFYSNDIFVLADILLRKLNDLPKGSPIIAEYCKTLCALLKWPEYRACQYRIDEVHETVKLLHENSKDENNRELGAAIETIRKHLRDTA